MEREREARNMTRFVVSKGQLREWRSGKERFKKRLCERMRGCVRPGPQDMDWRNLVSELRYRVKEK